MLHPANMKACFILGTILLITRISAENIGQENEQHQNLQRRSVLGSLKVIDSSENDLVKELSEFAVKTLDDVDEDNVKRTVVDILDAKKQLVNGIMYHLELKIQDTSCLEDQDLTYDDSCLSQTTGNPKICKIRMHRSFADKSPHNAKVVSSECKDEFEVVGAISEAKSNSDYIHSIASFAVDDLNGMTNSMYWYKLAEILEAKTQVVNGMNTYLTVELHSTNCLKHDKHKSDKVCGVDPDTLSKMVCHLVVWEQPWKNKKQVKKSSCSTLEDPKVTHNGSKKVKRSLPSEFKIVESNGWVEQDIEEMTPSDDLNLQYDSELTVNIVDDVDTTNYVSPHQRKIKNMARILKVSSSDKNLLSFAEFMSRENRMYESDKEMAFRFRVFRANMLKAEYLNKTEQGTATYGATMFADMTNSEFKKYLGLVYDPTKPPAKLPKMAEIPSIDIPPEFDWREKGVVTPVKNQGSCGSCWAFSVTGNIEGLYAIANNELLSLSEQELVDCDNLDNGCNGGFFNTAFESIEKLGGLETESDYPYEGRNEQCHFNRSSVQVMIRDYVNISSSEIDMAKWLVEKGPISIALNANAMQFYMGGVSHPLRFLCNPNNLDHGVLIVGYGVHHYPVFNKTLPYWLIKNSWGEQWGVQGYYMAYRGDGTCGLNKTPTSAILDY